MSNTDLKRPQLKFTGASGSLSFAVWFKIMKLHFMRNGFFSLVEGSRLRPEEVGEEQTKFDQDAASAFSDLVLSLDGRPLDFSLNFSSVNEAWKSLSQVYGASPELELQETERKIENFNFSNENLLEDLSELLMLYEALERLGGKVSVNQKTLKLFKCLPVEFSVFVIEYKTSSKWKASGEYLFSDIVEHLRSVVHAKEGLKGSEEEIKTEARVLKFKERKNICQNCKQKGHSKFQCPKCWVCKGYHHS